MGMARLIDADALKKEYLGKFWKACEDEDERFDAIGTMTKIINEAPTIEERPHGEWIEGIIGYHYCSKCRNFALEDEDEEEALSNFCPSCGADMRKEGEKK